MIEIRTRYIQITRLILLVVLGQLSGCVEASEWACQRSSDCPGAEICRIGECAPGDIYLTASAAENEQRSGDLRGNDGPGGDLPGGDSAAPDDTPPSPACPGGRPPAHGELVINEVLANVPADAEGDANADGVRDAYDDEFVEIVNRSADLLDISGVMLKVGTHHKFSFEETCMRSMEAAVIFGGGQPAVQRHYQVYVARARLALGNSGGSVTLLGADGARIDAMSYGESAPMSWTLSPEVEGTDYVAHQELAPERLFSPGTCANGADFAQGCGSKTPGD